MVSTEININTSVLTSDLPLPSGSWWSTFPVNLSYFHVHLAGLLGITAGIIWDWYGDAIKFSLFDWGTSAYTWFRLNFGSILPYLPNWDLGCFSSRYNKANGLSIHGVTFHFRANERNRPTLRVELSPEGRQKIASGEITPEIFQTFYGAGLTESSSDPLKDFKLEGFKLEDFKLEDLKLEDLKPEDFKLEDLMAMTIEYTQGLQNQRLFHLLPYGQNGDWCGVDRFLPSKIAIRNEDYVVTQPEDPEDLVDPLRVAMQAYLEWNPDPSATLDYLSDNPEVFQIPHYPDWQIEPALDRFFEKKEAIILEDDLGDLRRIGMF